MNSFTRRNVGQMQPQAKTQQPSNMLRPQNMQRGAQMAPTGTPINFRANLGTPAQTQSLAQSAGFMPRPIFGPLPVNPPSQPPSQPPMLMPAPTPPGLSPEMQLQALLEQKRKSELLGNLYFSGLGGLRR